MINDDIGHLGLRKWVALKACRSLYKERIEKHPLRTLFWEATLRCNLNCRHCGSDCTASHVTPDMPAEDFFRVLDESISKRKSDHPILVIVSGGEVLVREDLEEIGRGLMERGYPWGMVTNGMLLTEERLASLMKAGLKTIALSLDGFEAVHNDIRQNPRSFERAISALRAMVRAPNLTYDIITCVTHKLIPDLAKLRDFLIAEGVVAWRLGTISPMGRAAEMPDLLLDGDDTRLLLDFIAQTRKEGKIDCSFTCDGFLGNYEGEVRDHFYQCSAGITTGGILVDGSISACTSIRGKHIQGNIYQDDFMSVWESRFEKYRDRTWAKKGACKTCKMWSFCQGNGMHLYDENDNLTHCDYIKMTCGDIVLNK